MDRMDRTDYPGMLPKLQPGQAVDILNDRVQQVGRLNNSIANWLQERSKLEEQYAAGLRKLARKPVDDADLGIFSVPWGTITNSMDTLADSHSLLASKIEVDVERPLREFTTSNREMQAMTTIQGNLASMAKDIERSQQKTEKLQGKGEKAEASKVANASSDLDNAKAQWESQAPYVFETLQALDETRVNQIRDLLTQLETLEIDQVDKNRTTAEQCLNILLNVETQDEIKTFAIKAVSQKPSASRPQRASIVPGFSAPTPSRGTSSNALSTIPSNPDDDASQISGTPEPSKKSFGKGLKSRFGTVMSRRKEGKQASTLPSTSESPERKPKSSPFGRLGRSKDSYSLEPPQEETSSQRPRSPLRMGSEVLEPPESRHEPASPSRPPQLDPIPHMNGTLTSARSPISGTYSNGSHQGDLADLEPPMPVQPEAPTLPALAEPQRDSEGFSVPPQDLDPISAAQAEAAAAGELSQPQFNVNIRNAPIQEEGREAALASITNKLAPPPTQRRQGTIRGRRDARNSAVISTYGPPDQSPSEPITVAQPPVVERAMLEPISTQVQPTTVQPPTQPSLNSLVQSPSGAFSPLTSAGGAAFSPFSPAGDPQSPVRPSSRAAFGTDHSGDNQSIRSGRSLGSTTSQAMKHPEMHEPGLNSSIVETVSARFDNGRILTSSLVGEIALIYNPTDATSTLGQEAIRLENFSTLEKVAPNPAFIKQTPNKEGEYSLSLASITKMQIGFKYQIRQDDTHSQAPLLVTPAVKIDNSNQASVIVSYSLQPGFALQGRESITVSNVTIALTLEGSKATGCQSRPVGTFVREKSLIYWQLGDVTLTPGATPKKLLARFATESEATAGSVEGRWEISGANAHGLGSGISVSQSGAGDGADPFADEEGAPGSSASWKSVPVVRKLASGSYVAKS